MLNTIATDSHSNAILVTLNKAERLESVTSRFV